MYHFKGTCDVCGAEIATDWDPTQGPIDTLVEDIDSDHYRVGTWMRHYATAPPDANPDCAVYSSQVYTAALKHLSEEGRLALRPDGYDWRFLQTAGSFTDTGSEACR